MNKIEIDRQSGCCFGVAKAISKAEEELKKGGTLYCLGDLVHNSLEVERLSKLGLITIDHEQFKQLKNVRVLLRAHGEPPSTYEIARENNIEIIDASCPVVLGLQKRIKRKYNETSDHRPQIVIYGKKGHAEVNGLIGQTEETAIIIENKEDLDKLDFTHDINLFSQRQNRWKAFWKLPKSSNRECRVKLNLNFSIRYVVRFQTAYQTLKNLPDNMTSSFLSPEKKVLTEKFFLPNAKKSIQIRILSTHPKKWICHLFPMMCQLAFAGPLPRLSGRWRPWQT